MPLLPGSNWMRYGGGITGNICGSYVQPTSQVNRGDCRCIFSTGSRHVACTRYVIRCAGRRWTCHSLTTSGRSLNRTPIEIPPSRSNQRTDWPNDLRHRLPPDPTDLLSDVLPSVLGLPDDASLEIVLGCLYHSDAALRRYALYGFSNWPDELTSWRLQAHYCRAGVCMTKYSDS